MKYYTLYLVMLLSCSSAAQTQEITFTSGTTLLTGTLALPKGAGPFPAVVFLHGSGASTREESKQRAKWLTKAGFAVLTYDKRGVGASQGNADFHRYYHFDTLAQDALAAFSFLAEQEQIDGNRMGMVAASQSGWVAPLVAKAYPSLAFIVMISASVCTVAEDNLFERNRRLELEGFSGQDLQEAREMQLLDIQLSRHGTGMDQYKLLWNKYRNRPWFSRVYLSDDPMPADHPDRLWYKTVLDQGPLADLKHLDQPILWMLGDANRDRFAPVDLSIKRLDSLTSHGKPYTIKQYSGADHNLHKSSYKEDLIKWCRGQANLD